MKELFFYLLGGFSGIFLMCCLNLAKKSDDFSKNKPYNHKEN